MALALDPVALGTYFGMVLGKPIGIAGMTFLMVKFGICELPRRVSWKHIVGVGIWVASAYHVDPHLGFGVPRRAVREARRQGRDPTRLGASAVVGMIYMSIVCKKKPARRSA